MELSLGFSGILKGKQACSATKSVGLARAWWTDFDSGQLHSRYMCETRNLTLLLLYWPVLLLLGILAIELLSGQLTGGTLLQKHLVRKSFHALAISLFLPPLMWGQQNFLALSQLVASILLIALEVCRVSRAPLSQLQDRYLAKYLDKREDISKDLLLTHLYLLLGCSLPVWLEMSMRHPNPLRSCSGVLLIGVGDSCAALLGIRFGRRRWPNSQRTFMGTAGFLMSISLVVFLLFSTIDHWQSSLLAAALTALLEVYTTSIDNLALPLFFCALHKSMEPWLQWLQG